ncbi:MAG: phenylalanine--tRNA ligase subunit beta [Bacteroidota bacterium]|nr:phenylalanine--tRNA ligase subunit beta [Bacteroidota bacterium]
MKISYNWLKTLINIDLPAEEVSVLLTDAGLEVEGLEYFESIKGGLKGILVGHVLECSKHPDADKLSLTRVDIGAGEPLSIVCGAPNVAAGQKVLIATVGTTLYPLSGEPLEIKKAKIRGAASEGMICAEDEIGLGASHAGILILPADTKVGLEASNYFKVERDVVFEIGLTPNRSDAASHFGVARDLAAILNAKNNVTTFEARLIGLNELPDATGLNKVDIEIKNTDACKRYTGLVVSGVEVKESPDWLKNRLQAIGLRPINNIVDITNFVLHETGQPLHAFDLDQIKGNKVIIDTAKEGIKFTTLDGVVRPLKSNDLMIYNSSEPMCIAGVFGGEKSGVSAKTSSVFIESAYFDPSFVRKTAKHHGLKTDASFRFERGTDPEMTMNAAIRAVNLIMEIGGGRISMGITDVYPEKLEPVKIAFSYNYCNDLIGKSIDKGIVKNIITSLGIIIENEGNDGLLLEVPKYKTDVIRAADVVEEVMRIYGYNNIETSKQIIYTAFNEEKNFDRIVEERVGGFLTSNGFNETMNLSLTKESNHQKTDDLVKVVNPLSNDLNVLRGDLLFGGLESLAYNINRKQANLKFYEIGKVYHARLNDVQSGAVNPAKDFKYVEDKHLSLLVTGNTFNENYYGLNQNVDLNYLKSIVENLLKVLGITNFTTSESSYNAFDYGLSYELNKNAIVEIGSVNKAHLNKFDIKQNVFYAQFNWSALVKAYKKLKVTFVELPLYPSVRRDLAMLLDKTVKYEQLKTLALNTERKLLKEVNLFDVYEGEKLGNKKSYALSFILQSEDATLTDKQIEKVMEKLIESYKSTFGAELR